MRACGLVHSATSPAGKLVRQFCARRAGLDVRHPRCLHPRFDGTLWRGLSSCPCRSAHSMAFSHRFRASGLQGIRVNNFRFSIFVLQVRVKCATFEPVHPNAKGCLRFPVERHLVGFCRSLSRSQNRPGIWKRALYVPRCGTSTRVRQTTHQPMLMSSPGRDRQTAGRAGRSSARAHDAVPIEMPARDASMLLGSDKATARRQGQPTLRGSPRSNSGVRSRSLWPRNAWRLVAVMSATRSLGTYCKSMRGASHC